VHIFSIFYTHHRVPNEHMMIWWQLSLIRPQIIIWSYLCDQNWWNIIKKKIDTSFHQRSLISVFQIRFNVYLLTSYMTRFGLWIFMRESTHDFWLWFIHWAVIQSMFYHLFKASVSINLDISLEIRKWFMPYNTNIQKDLLNGHF
jgi:hypothetical protein